MAADHFEQQRGVARPSPRTGRSGRATTRTRPARSATPRRRSASRRRRRTAPRAGGSSRRCRSRARAARSRPRPPPPSRRSSRPARATRSRGLRVGPNAEFSVERAHRELVEVGLADGDRAGRHARARRPSRRTAAASPRGSATSTWSATPRVQRLSLSAIGTPASGPGSSPRATAASIASAAARASSASTRLNACSSPLARLDAREVLVEHVPRRAACRRGRRRDPPSSATLTVPRRGCAGRGTGRPPPPAPRPAPRRAAGSGRTSSARNTFTSGKRVRGRRHVVRCRAPTTCAACSRIDAELGR